MIDYIKQTNNGWHLALASDLLSKSYHHVLLAMDIEVEETPAEETLSSSERSLSRHSMLLSQIVSPHQLKLESEPRFNPRPISSWYEGHKLS